MIRFLQRDNRVVKAFFVVIIGMASISMVVYLIPGLTGQGAAATDSYAVVYPHWYSKFLSAGATVTQAEVEKAARAQLAQQRYPDNPIILNMFEQRVGQQLVQQQVLLAEADKLGVRATAEDVRQYLQTGSAGQVLFPGGKFIGDDQYANLVATRFNMSVPEFEEDVRHDITIRRLQALVAGGVSVGEKEVRDEYRKGNIKIKFDYAVISSDDLRKTINPSDSDLEAFFKKNAARYSSAVPEQRKITYFAFTPTEIPGGVPQPSQQEIQAYFNAHKTEYSTPEQARARHILIKVDAGADPKADAAAKAKAEGLLKQIKGGADFADLAKKNSDDPGSKDSGGELPFAQHGAMVPEFDKAIFSQKIGDTEIVKSQFGYHIVQVEERKPAQQQDISQVLPTIQATLIRQKSAAAEENYANSLTAEAAKSGLEKTAAAHHLEVVTTPLVGKQGVISSLPDGSQILTKAFAEKQGDPPQSAATGEGYAIFQVTGIQAAHAPTFADWKDHVLEDYRADTLPGLLNAKTQQLADKAKAENDLAKAAKEMGATVKTSDLVGGDGQVPDLGQVGQVAPQLLELSVGAISGPIDAARSGVVAKILDKQEPTPDQIAKNFDQTRDQMVEERRSEAFNVFLSGIMADYKKNKRIAYNAKAQEGPKIPGAGL
jgi:peptidyl-prolyl cis-trans isomerase D